MNPVPAVNVSLARGLARFAVALVTFSPAPTLGAELNRYRAEWTSVDQHPMPDWLLDAKFGIYAHWGVYPRS